MTETASPAARSDAAARADEFDPARATTVLAALCAKQFSGRGVGTVGHDEAGEYIAETLRALGLNISRQTFDVPALFRLDTEPSFEVVQVGGTRSLEHRRDYAEHPRSAGMGMPIAGIAAPWDGTARAGTWIILESVPQGQAFTDLADLARAAGAIGILTPQQPDASGFLVKRVVGAEPVGLPVIAVRAEHLPGIAGGLVRAHVPVLRGGGVGTNIFATLAGTDPAMADRPVLVTAHYDGVGSDPGRHFECAGDNASGVAVLCEAARVLAAQPTRPARPVVFAALDAEELGALGSKDHARRLAAQGIRPDVLNLDMAGKFNGVVAVELGPDSKALIDALDRAGRALAYPLGVSPVASDNRQYAGAGLSAAGIGLGAAHYHSPLDTADRIDPQALLIAGRLLLAAITNLAYLD